MSRGGNSPWNEKATVSFEQGGSRALVEVCSSCPKLLDQPM